MEIFLLKFEFCFLFLQKCVQENDIIVPDGNSVVISIQSKQGTSNARRLSSDDESDSESGNSKKTPQTIVVDKWDSSRPINIVLNKNRTSKKLVESSDDEGTIGNHGDKLQQPSSAGADCSSSNKQSTSTEHTNNDASRSGVNNATNDVDWGVLTVSDATLMSFADAKERENNTKSNDNNDDNTIVVEGSDYEDHDGEDDGSTIYTTEEESGSSSESEDTQGDLVAERCANRSRRKAAKHNREITNRFTQLKEERNRKLAACNH